MLAVLEVLDEGCDEEPVQYIREQRSERSRRVGSVAFIPCVRIEGFVGQQSVARFGNEAFRDKMQSVE